MKVDQQEIVQEEIRRKRQEVQEEDGTVVEDVAEGCLYLPDFSDGCVPDLPGCSGNDNGCLPDFDGGCIPDFDGCSYSGLLFPLRIMVIVGLILYGDWDFRRGCPKLK